MRDLYQYSESFNRLTHQHEQLIRRRILFISVRPSRQICCMKVLKTHTYHSVEVSDAKWSHSIQTAS